MFQFKQARRSLAIIAVHLSILLPASDAADNLGILGAHPRWNVLEKYQETITHDEFTRLIQDAYCTHGFAPDLIAINDKNARILTNRDAQKFFTLRFAEDEASRQPVPRLWRSGTSRREMGEDGGALVSSRRKRACAGRRPHVARGAINCAAVTKIGRTSFFCAQQPRAGHAKAAGRFSGAR